MKNNIPLSLPMMYNPKDNFWDQFLDPRIRSHGMVDFTNPSNGYRERGHFIGEVPGDIIIVFVNGFFYSIPKANVSLIEARYN